MTDLRVFLDSHFDTQSTGSRWEYVHCKICGAAVGLQYELLTRHVGWHRDQEPDRAGEPDEWKPGDIALWTFDETMDPMPIARIVDSLGTERWSSIAIDHRYEIAGHIVEPQPYQRLIRMTAILGEPS
jgi:hypothetical protein